MKTSTHSPSAPAPVHGREILANLLPDTFRVRLRLRLRRWGLLALGALAVPVPPAQAEVNQFELTGSLVDGRRLGHTATLLPDGRVWVVGGLTNAVAKTSQNASTDLYDSATGLWSIGPSFSPGRYGHTASLLPNGKVLIYGGVGDSAPPGNISSEYNHINLLVDVPNYFVAEQINSSSSLDHGPNATATVTGGTQHKVIIVGGEFYRPSSGDFVDEWSGVVFAHADPPFRTRSTITPTEWLASISSLRYRTLHAAAILPGSRALIVGGFQDVPLDTAEIGSQDGDVWSFTGSLITARHSHTATALKDGKVLVAGGVGAAGALNTAELYDPSTGVWTATGSFGGARSSHTATLLWDGRVLIAGGNANNGSAQATARIYDPATGNWSAVGSLVTPLSHHTATLLPNRKVLIVEPTSGQAQLFDSPYRDIAVEQPVATALANGGGATFTAAVSGSAQSKTFTIRNAGTQFLGGINLTKTGAHAADFTVTANPTNGVAVGASTTFTIRFAPATTGTKTAAIQIANNTVGDSSYVINLTGYGIVYNADNDGDGISNGQELEMAALGFDWQVDQPELVATYFATANGSGLYTTAQVHTLNVGMPLLTRDAATGKFKLTVEVMKTGDLGVPFSDFPMNGTGKTTLINAQGKLEFVFPPQGNAAFFRVQAQ